MTDMQFQRWEEFALRMAKQGYPKATATRKEKILKQVTSYFEWRHFQEDWPEIEDWDGNDDEYFLGDQVNDFFSEYSHYQRREGSCGGNFYNQVVCCIRAGFDVAVQPSGGVVGFSAGDVRRMWDGNVPDWVRNFLEDPFDLIPDEDGVWL